MRCAQVVGRMGGGHPEHVRPRGTTRLQAGWRVFHDEAPANVEAERRAASRYPCGSGLPSRTSSAATNTSGTGSPAAASRARISTCDPDVTAAHRPRREARQEVARGRERDHVIEVCHLQPLKLSDRRGALVARQKLGHRVLRAAPVTDPEDLRGVDPAGRGPCLPRAPDRSGRVHQCPVDVEQDRVHLKAHGRQPTRAGADPGRSHVPGDHPGPGPAQATSGKLMRASLSHLAGSGHFLV